MIPPNTAPHPCGGGTKFLPGTAASALFFSGEGKNFFSREKKIFPFSRTLIPFQEKRDRDARGRF